MAPHSSTLAWKIPWTEEPGRLQSMLKIGHDWATSLSLFTFMHWRRKWQPTPVFLPRESQGQGSLVGLRPLPLQRLKRSLTFHLEVRYGTWHLWCDTKSSPTHWSHWRGTPRFPASPHLCPFSPPDRDRRVDSPALSARASDLPGAPKDEAGLTRKFEM